MPYRAVTRDEFERDSARALNDLESALPYPMFVKPAVLGSSVAVSRADGRTELESALDLARRFCNRILVEQALDGAADINCAVLDGDPPVASVLEQPVSHERLLTFDEKYRGGKKGSKGMAGLKRLVPAPIEPELAGRITAAALKVFAAVGAGGVARVDFLVCNHNDFFVNEINNIPGSFSYYLWEHMGRSFRELLDRMIDRAVEVRRRRNRTVYAFEGNLLAGGK
jgi:D-alanine-D-alanine ligase